MVDYTNHLEPQISQQYATIALTPYAAGWSLQIFLAGIATTMSVGLLRNHASTQSGVPCGRILLALAILFNMACTAGSGWEIQTWLTTQSRSLDGLFTLHPADMFSPLLQAACGFCVQAFMALRCWKVARKSLFFAFPIAGGIFTVIGASAWIVVAMYRYNSNKSYGEDILVATQIYLWISVAVDLVISITLSLHFAKEKRRLDSGFNRGIESLLNSLIRLSFETFIAPFIFATVTAIVFVCTWRSPDMFGYYYLTMSAIPSIYLLSLVQCIQGTVERRNKYHDSSRSTLPSFVGRGLSPTTKDGSDPKYTNATASKSSLLAHSSGLRTQEEGRSTPRIDISYDFLRPLHLPNTKSYNVEAYRAREQNTAASPQGEGISVDGHSRTAIPLAQMKEEKGEV